ncbi:class I SAM-dependent methyltransferase [Microvirga terricola]|uniref:Class I SAM-dependent methyltransferase n=1 Tax=Microvirga terricola TaxID=2719797 RepID=A0ABX0V9Y8_9HYPH|nr:class I SAM-dependent methyltransferase [Microvirga terricola]NIX76658.1 class I SAM-dependent methyltransferase [Microvirga terricola]
MPRRRDDIRANYASPDIVERVHAAVSKIARMAGQLTADMLYPFDQIHVRELAATREHVERLHLEKGMQVVDVGCGIGGPARYIAMSHDVHVTGVDPVPEFIAAARDLTRRCGLEDRIVFQEADALAMPFGDNSFDAALCLYMAMNIADKGRLCREIHRVLKPGGRVVWSEIVLGPVGPARFPLPWASTPSASFLVPGQVLRQIVSKNGLRIVSWSDETERFVSRPVNGGSAGSVSASLLPTGHRLVMGAEQSQSQNLLMNMMEGRLLSILIEAQKM